MWRHQQTRISQDSIAQYGMSWWPYYPAFQSLLNTYKLQTHRDSHVWVMDISYNINRVTSPHNMCWKFIWVLARQLQSVERFPLPIATLHLCLTTEYHPMNLVVMRSSSITYSTTTAKRVYYHNDSYHQLYYPLLNMFPSTNSYFHNILLIVIPTVQSSTLSQHLCPRL